MPPAEPSRHLALTHVSSDEDIVQMLAETDKAIVRVNGELTDLQKRSDVKFQLSATASLRPKLAPLLAGTGDVKEKLDSASSLASDVSGRIRELDLAKTRLNLALSRVSDILDVKNCIDGVQWALYDGDYEKASKHVQRFLDIDRSVVEPAAYEVLKAHEEKLYSNLQDKAKECADKQDFQGVKRFCKLMASIGHTDDGLALFIEYLRKVLRTEANDDFEGMISRIQAAKVGSSDEDAGTDTAYVALLDRLFRVIANMFQRYESFVRNNFGGAAAVLQLAQSMQGESEGHATRIITQFMEARNMKAVNAKLEQEARQARAQPSDPRDYDGLLDEMAIVLGRCEMYDRFIKSKAKAAMDEMKDTGTAKHRASSVGSTTGLRPNTELHHAIREVVVEYIQLETFFMNESVGKAVRIDTWSAGDVTSSMIEDVFFVLHKCALRATATCSIHVVQAMIQQLTIILSQSYHSALMNFGARAANKDVSQLVQDAKGFLSGGGGAKEKERASPENANIIALNNAEVSSTYIVKLKDAMEKGFDSNFENDEEQRERVQPLFQELAETANSLTSIVEGGQNFLFETVQAEIRKFVDTFQSVNFELTEAEQARNEAEDPFVQSLITGLDTIIKSLREILTESNTEAIVQRTLHSVTTRIEEVAMQKKFNQLGGLQFDKDVRTLKNYFNQVSTSPIRDKFTRLTQIAFMLGSLEDASEIGLYWGEASSMNWRLSADEVRRVLSLRAEFSTQQVAAVEL